MTIPEKQQLCRLLRNLPANNLDRVVEIVGHKDPSVDNSCELNIDIQKLVGCIKAHIYSPSELL